MYSKRNLKSTTLQLPTQTCKARNSDLPNCTNAHVTLYIGKQTHHVTFSLQGRHLFVIRERTIYSQCGKSAKSDEKNSYFLLMLKAENKINSSKQDSQTNKQINQIYLPISSDQTYANTEIYVLGVRPVFDYRNSYSEDNTVKVNLLLQVLVKRKFCYLLTFVINTYGSIYSFFKTDNAVVSCLE